MLFIIIFVCIYIFIELKTKYSIIKPLKSLSSKGNLIICTHSYEHKDVFIMLQELQKSSKKYVMLFADKIWNHLLEPLRPNNVEFLFIKGNTVNTISSKLLLGCNIVMFLYLLNIPSTGPYYILQNTNCDVNLVKIKSKTEPSNHLNSSIINIMINNMFSTFNIEYIKIKYSLNNNPKYFMNQLINTLYN
tara:strand:+ start:181 stop:750 length:570 start_codon:yes stop_codon:yes gene_type:complete